MRRKKNCVVIFVVYDTEFYVLFHTKVSLKCASKYSTLYMFGKCQSWNIYFAIFQASLETKPYDVPTGSEGERRAKKKSIIWHLCWI